MALDCKAVNTALAKALAYKKCGKPEEANRWAARLVQLLGCAGVLHNAYYEKDGRLD